MRVSNDNFIRDARTELGELWGLERHLTVGELARVLGLRGERASETVVHWESGKTEPTGPVKLAVSLMLEPPSVRIDEAMAALCNLSAEPHRETLGQLLLHHFGDEARAMLEEMVLTVSDIVRRPAGAEEAVSVTQFQNRDARYRGDRPAVKGRRQRRS